MERVSGENRSNDGRLFERMPCSFNVELTESDNQHSQNALATDFSGSGFGVRTKRRISVGDSVEVKIYHSGAADPILQAAQVVWSKEEEEGDWRMGLEFPSYNLTRFIPLMSSLRDR